ncbi:hypothetical protein K443DRAFT_14478 [Laccaria amethystina LaAM-08-1]|uniref:Uncharacterized protein n=1 Tax=Laccaria amethystina LaAM-08-1 TaxID=1095629 RepID=A0A0C9WHK4_9AGAR|nr:hypothetical protein K443DRAFT_14478 [Laccaria amethystina LaAM-08-1]
MFVGPTASSLSGNMWGPHTTVHHQFTDDTHPPFSTRWANTAQHPTPTHSPTPTPFANRAKRKPGDHGFAPDANLQTRSSNERCLRVAQNHRPPLVRVQPPHTFSHPFRQYCPAHHFTPNMHSPTPTRFAKRAKFKPGNHGFALDANPQTHSGNERRLWVTQVTLPPISLSPRIDTFSRTTAHHQFAFGTHTFPHPFCQHHTPRIVSHLTRAHHPHSIRKQAQRKPHPPTPFLQKQDLAAHRHIQ